MLFGEGAFGLVLLGLWIFCILDVITTPEQNMNHLPKGAWLLIVLLLPDIGSIVWLIVGRDRRTAVPRPGAAQRAGYPEYDRPGRATAASPEDDEAFLRQVRERADRQRRAYEARREADRTAEQDELLRRRRDED
jgi:hypothetical protein